MTREARLDWLCRLRSVLVWVDFPPQEKPTFVQALSEVIEDLEQEPILDKIKAEISDTLYVDSLILREMLDFRNRISVDDIIEEFNRVTKIEVLKIIECNAGKRG